MLVEAASIQNAGEGTMQASGGNGGNGGNGPPATGMPGGAGGAGGVAGAAGGPGGPTVQSATKASGCSWGDDSGAGGGGGAGGYVSARSRGVPCACHADTDCSTAACANVDTQCTGTCTGSTASGAYDAFDCQIVTTIAE